MLWREKVTVPVRKVHFGFQQHLSCVWLSQTNLQCFHPPQSPVSGRKVVADPISVCLFGGSLDSTARSTLLSTWGHVVYASELTQT